MFAYRKLKVLAPSTLFSSLAASSTPQFALQGQGMNL